MLVRRLRPLPNAAPWLHIDFRFLDDLTQLLLRDGIDLAVDCASHTYQMDTLNARMPGRIGIRSRVTQPRWGAWCTLTGWLLVTALTLAGCGTNGGTADSVATRTITDMEGRKVRVPAPDRIRHAAILTSPAVQIAYILGVQDTLCAVTQAVRRWPLLAQFDPRIERVPACRATAGQVNLETLLATSPDICIGSEMDLQSVEAQTSIPALRVAAGGSTDFTRQIKDELAFLGRVFGREERARQSLEWLDDSRTRLHARVSDVEVGSRPRVFMGFGTDHLTTFGVSTFMHEWIEIAGCRNAAESVSTAGGKEGGMAQVSMEQVLRWAPDVIVLDEGDAAALSQDPQWMAVPAVRTGRVFRLPTGVFIWNRASFESAALLPIWLSSTARCSDSSSPMRNCAMCCTRRRDDFDARDDSAPHPGTNPLPVRIHRRRMRRPHARARGEAWLECSPRN